MSQMLSVCSSGQGRMDFPSERLPSLHIAAPGAKRKKIKIKKKSKENEHLLPNLQQPDTRLLEPSSPLSVSSFALQMVSQSSQQHGKQIRVYRHRRSRWSCTGGACQLVAGFPKTGGSMGRS